jgi:hypothetical protein
VWQGFGASVESWERSPSPWDEPPQGYIDFFTPEVEQALEDLRQAAADRVASACLGRSNTHSECTDGVDNDGDRLVDEDDPGCETFGDHDETRAYIACDDGWNT